MTITVNSFGLFIPKLCETPEPALTWARWPSCYHPWRVHFDPRPFFPWLMYLLIFLFWFHSDTHFLSCPIDLLTPVKCLRRYKTIGSCTWGPLKQHFTPALFIFYHPVQWCWSFSPGQPRKQKLLKCMREPVCDERRPQASVHIVADLQWIKIWFSSC